MANTFTLISSVAVGAGGSTNIDFTSIPSTYTDLLVKFSGRLVPTSSVANVYAIFNSDSGANYKMKRLYGDGANPYSDSNQSMVNVLAGGVAGSNDTANTFSNVEFYVPNYTSSNQKSVSVDSVHETNGATAYSYAVAVVWTGTSAISSIRLSSTSNFAQYTTAYLYGIKNS